MIIKFMDCMKRDMYLYKSSGIAIHVYDNYKKAIVLLPQGYCTSRPSCAKILCALARIILMDSRVHMAPHMLFTL